MKFEIGDATDSALCTTLVHELFLCRESFERFTRYAELNIMGRRDKATKIRSHDAYSSFLHHLYEFYVGCIKRNRRDTKEIDSYVLDRIFNSEAEKQLRIRVERIEQGRAPAWENHISVYRVDVPNDFGKRFRQIRNRTVHASIDRSAPGQELTLGQFYKECHKFIFLLYDSSHWLWSVEDIEKNEWKAIEEFDLAFHQ